MGASSRSDSSMNGRTRAGSARSFPCTSGWPASSTMLLEMWWVVVMFPATSSSATNRTHSARVSSPARSAAAICDRTLPPATPSHPSSSSLM